MRMFVFKSGSLIQDERFDQSVVVGAAEECALRLQDPKIAHKQICFAPAGGGKWTLQQLDGSQIVQVNGATLRGERELRDLDEVALGSFTLKIYLTSDGKAAEPEAAPRHVRRDTFTPPQGSILRRHGDSVVLTPQRLFEHAEAVIELSGATEPLVFMERMLTRVAAMLLPAGTLSVRVFQRTAAGLEIIRTTDAKGRPVDPPSLAALLAEFCSQHQECVCLPEIQSPGAASAMAVPLIGSRGTALGSIYVDSTEARAFNTASLDLLAGFAAAIAAPLERIVHRTTVARAQEVDRELQLARQVQDALTLQAMPNWPEVQVAAYRRPGSLSCRDHYDVLRLANKTVAALIARIGAAGVLAPRIMSEIHAAFRASCLHTDAPHVFARTMNWLVADIRGEVAIDLLAAWIVPESNALKYCLAGQGLGAGVLTKEGEWHELKSENAPAIGRVRGFAYALQSQAMQASDMLAVVTPGADTYKNAAGQPFGRERVTESLRDLAGTAINVMLTDLVSELDEFGAGGLCRDDLTVLLAHRST